MPKSIWINNWGRQPKIRSKQYSLQEYETSQNVGDIIVRGLGRSYGDAGLEENHISLLEVDEEMSIADGFLHCHAGHTLDQVLKFIVPKGYFVPVTPGTKFVTIGGMIAADVHGKNHHVEGSMSNHVIHFDLVDEQKRIHRCSREENGVLFWNTFGAMGLTGIITKVAIKLKPINSSFITVEQQIGHNLDQTFHLMDSSIDSTYAVSWLDCTSRGKRFGRSVLYTGEHATGESGIYKTHGNALLGAPPIFPSFLITGGSIRVFNATVWLRALMKRRKSRVHYDPFFYPLDKINNWNRVYGKKGMAQYQFVVPLKVGRRAISRVLETIQSNKVYPFLTVLKRFGPGNERSPLSFPFEGYTLAMDFKISNRSMNLMNELDNIVAQFGGRLYLAKDGRMSKSFFQQSYPNNQKVASAVFSSLQAKRLGLKR